MSKTKDMVSHLREHEAGGWLDDIADRLEALEAVASALDRCEDNRGRFSCAEAHDCRCPAARVKDGQVPPRCECGGDALLAAVGALEATGWQPEETRSE